MPKHGKDMARAHHEHGADNFTHKNKMYNMSWYGDLAYFEVSRQHMLWQERNLDMGLTALIQGPLLL